MANQWKLFWNHPYAKYIFGVAILIIVLALIFQPDFERFRDGIAIKGIAIIVVGFVLYFFIRWINQKWKSQ